jgi:hypothetical protein
VVNCGGYYERSLSDLLARLPARTLFLSEEPNVSVPRVLIDIQPGMYAEVLAFSLGQYRPHAEVSILGPSEELEEAALRLRPHLVVANRVPEAAREGSLFFFWVEVDEARAGEGARRLGAQISADGYSKSVEDLSTEHVLGALDRAERELVSEGQDLARGGRGSS